MIHNPNILGHPTAIPKDPKKAKHHHPWRLYIEDFTLFELIGDLTGKTVLDLACGEGFYTRRIKQRGATQVVGVDVSERMIDLARAEETKSSLGIEYVIQDVTQLHLSICFDLVVAAYLLNHARTREELLVMCQAVSGSLKPGCRFVAVNNNAEVRFVDPKPNLKQVWGMGPELRRGNDLWLENLILV